MNAPAIRMVAIDLDGTLLNSAKQVTPRTAEVLRQAVAANVKVVLATARPPRSVLPFYETVGLDAPMINYNGALVYDPTCKRVLMHRPVPVAIARGIVNLARRLFPEIRVSAEIMDHWYTDFYDTGYLTETARIYSPDVIAPIDEWLDRAVTKIMLLGEAEQLLSVASAIHLAFPHQVGIVQTEDYLVQIMHATVSKAQALRMVAGELSVNREEVMAIGDNANDVGMIRWAGMGVAVANAAPSAKAAAKILTDDNDSDGPANIIERLVLQG